MIRTAVMFLVTLSVLFAFLLSLGTPCASASQPAPIPAPAAPENQPPAPMPQVAATKAGQVLPQVEKIAPGKYRMGEILIDKSSKSVEFPAEINMEKGLLEYLVVRNSGKTHESLLRTGVQPFHLQVACLLVGLEGTDAPLARQGAPELPTGDPVEIHLVLADGTRLTPERWMTKMVDGEKKEVGKFKWIFTGSLVGEGGFAAQIEGSMVAVYHDPVALIDNSSPGGESDKIWYVREGALPPAGTPVTVVIKALP